MAPQPRAGLTRTLEALGELASELESRRRMEARPQDDWRASLIDSQRKVIEHYRHVLARQRVPPAERTAILERIARIENEIRMLQERPAATAYPVAA